MEGIPEIYAFYVRQAPRGEAPALSEVERLTQEFEAHEGEESKFLAQYRRVALKTQNPLVKFFLQMIISDEEKHHAATQAMAATLKADLNWSAPDRSLRGLFELGEEKNKLLRITADFIRVEREGIKKYGELIKSSRGYYRDLFTVLFESMIHDSEKHIEILKFLHRRLEEA